MRPSFTLQPDLTGHLHGYCVRYGAEEVDVFPTFDGAAAGLRAARAALTMLDALLAPQADGGK